MVEQEGDHFREELGGAGPRRRERARREQGPDRGGRLCARHGPFRERLEEGRDLVHEPVTHLAELLPGKAERNVSFVLRALLHATDRTGPLGQRPAKRTPASFG